MRIIITDLQITLEKRALVKFKTEFGNGNGVWKTSPLPVIGNSYLVEFDLAEPLIWDKEIMESQAEKYSIMETAAGMIWQGKIEMIDEDNILTIRIGDGLFMVEVLDRPAKLAGSVQLTLNEIDIYDSHF